MRDKKLSLRDVGGMLDWSHSRVDKILRGIVRLTLPDLSALCFAVDLPVTEALRDRGMEFYAEMTPTELRVLERLRALPKAEYEAMLVILRVRPTPTSERFAKNPQIEKDRQAQIQATRKRNRQG